MAVGFSISGTTGNIVDVTAPASTTVEPNAAKVALATTKERAGFACITSEHDSGAITGTRIVRNARLSDDFRLKIGIDRPDFYENFPGTALSSALWNTPTTTMTVTVLNGFVQLNAAAILTTATSAQILSRRSFLIPNSFPLIGEVQASVSQPPVNNNVTEIGFLICTGTSAPTDGAFFRFNAGGEFRCVIVAPGGEIQSDTLDFASLIGANTTCAFRVCINEDNVEFRINTQMVAVISRATSGPFTITSGSLPIGARTYNSGATAAGQTVRIGGVTVYSGDTPTALTIADQQSLAGYMGYQGPTGGTMGSTSNYTNSMAIAAGVLPTNTTAALGSGLGGQFSELNTLAANTDGIISSYQVPAGTAAVPGRTLLVYGVKISSYVQALLVTGGNVEQWSLAFGHTAVSLAQAESATAKAPRRLIIGARPVIAAAPVLTQLNTLELSLKCPIAVYPGEFIQTVKKAVGTAGTGGTIVHVISFDSVWV